MTSESHTLTLPTALRAIGASLIEALVVASMIMLTHACLDFSSVVAGQERKAITRETIESFPGTTQTKTDAEATGIKFGEVRPGEKLDVSLQRPNSYDGWTQSVRDEKTDELIEERAFDRKGKLRELTTYRNGTTELTEFDERGGAIKDTTSSSNRTVEREYFPGG